MNRAQVRLAITHDHAYSWSEAQTQFTVIQRSHYWDVYGATNVTGSPASWHVRIYAPYSGISINDDPTGFFSATVTIAEHLAYSALATVRCVMSSQTATSFRTLGIHVRHIGEPNPPKPCTVQMPM